MTRFTGFCLAVLLAVTACTSADTANSNQTTENRETAPETTEVSAATLSADVTEVVGGASVDLTAVGLGESPTWSAGDGSIVGEGAEVTYTAPQALGEFTVTASNGSAEASIAIVVYEATLYESDFSTSVGEEWTTERMTTSPSGEQFLGEFGDGSISLSIEGLPTHDEVSISFDLYILRSWSGLAEEAWWSLGISETEVIRTTFSNDGQLQAWPGNLPYASNPGRSGATANDTLGYWYETEDNPLDSIYRVERAFFHEGGEVEFEFSGHDLSELSDHSWGLDNIEVKISNTLAAVSRPEPSLVIQIDGRDMRVNGAVPDPSIEATIASAAADHFDGWNLTMDLQSVEGALTPMWTTQLADILEDLEDAVDVTLEFGLRTGGVDGTVVTERYHRDLLALVQSKIGINGSVSDSVELVADQAHVEHISDSVVLFDTGLSVIKPEAAKILDEIAALLLANDRIRVIAIGHTDVTGADMANEGLSWERAEAVVAYMEALGVPEDQVTVNGKGSQEPAQEGDTPDALSANRRVEFFVLDG